MPKPPLPTCTKPSWTAPSSTSPLSFPAANSLLLHLPPVGAPTTIPVSPRQDLEEEAAAADATDPPDLVVVDVTHIVPIPIDLAQSHDRDPARAPLWQRAEEPGGTGPGHALGLPEAVLLARGPDVVEEEEAAEEEEGMMWITTEHAGVLAALVTTAMTAGAGAGAAAVIGTDVRYIRRAGVRLPGQPEEETPRSVGQGRSGKVIG